MQLSKNVNDFHVSIFSFVYLAISDSQHCKWSTALRHNMAMFLLVTCMLRTPQELFDLSDCGLNTKHVSLLRNLLCGMPRKALIPHFPVFLHLRRLTITNSNLLSTHTI